MSERPPRAPRVPSGRPPVPPPPRKKAVQERRQRIPVQAQSSPAARPPATVLGRKTEPEDLKARRLEKKRASRRLIWRRIIGALCVLVVLLGLAWIALFSSLFALQPERIEIQAPEGLDTASASAAAQAQTQKSILLISGPKLKEQILQDTAIQDAVIMRSWPDGLNIQLTARVPIAAVVAEDGFALVGADGVVVASVAEVPYGLPTIDADVDVSSEVLTDVQTVLAALPEDLRGQVSQVRLAGGLHTVLLSSGGQILWGDADDSELKAQVLGLLAAQRPSAVYDVTDPTRPSIR